MTIQVGSSILERVVSLVGIGNGKNQLLTPDNEAHGPLNLAHLPPYLSYYVVV
jgi:hypothetical protein